MTNKTSTFEIETFKEKPFFDKKNHLFPLRGTSLSGGDYNDYDDYGNSFDESGYTLPGIIVTPDGNYPEDDSWDNGYDPWNDSYQDDDWGFDDFIGSGGNSHGSSFDKDYSKGIAVLNAMNDSIKNGNALVVEKISDSTAYTVCNLANYAGNFAIPSMDLYSYYFGETDKIAKLGKAFAKGNLFASTALAIIAYADTEEIDWWGVAGALAGLGAIICPATTLIPLVLDGVAIFCGAMSLINGSSDSQQSNTSY